MATDTKDWRGTEQESAGQFVERPMSREDQEQSDRDKEILEEVRAHLAHVKSVEDEQRKREEEDLAFEAGDQWTQEALDAREEQEDEVSGRTTPARPALTINLTDQPIQQILSEARQARLSVTVKPKAGRAQTKTANYYKGLMRAVQVEAGAAECRLWALEQAIKCGRGAYEIFIDYANDQDSDSDILYGRILDSSTVYWDPYAKRPDFADADRCLVSDFITESQHKRRWKDKPIQGQAGMFEDEADDWFPAAGDDVKDRPIRYGRYYRVEYTERLLVFHPQIGHKFLDELPEDLRRIVQQKSPDVRTRSVPQRRVRIYDVDGSQVLAASPWPGRYIPIIPVIGKEYFLKRRRMWKGAVANVKDVARGYNVAMSSAVELAGTMPRVPYLMAAGQDAGFEDMWDYASVNNYTRLYYNVKDVEGTPVGAPQRQNIDPQIQASLLLAEALKNNVGELMGAVSPAFRAVKPYDRSGKAIEALQRQGAAGTSNYLDNLATISMLQEGRVVVDLVKHVYDRPGRQVYCMGEENDDETAVLIKVPFIRDADNNPVPVPCPKCQGQGTVGRIFAEECPACRGSRQATRENMPKDYHGQPVEYVDFAEGEFKVAVSVGRSFQTAQDEALAAMSDLAKAAPPLVLTYADLWVRAMGFPGSQEIADRIKANNPAAQGNLDERKVPPELKAKFVEMQVQHQAALEEIARLTQTIETDQVKAESQQALQQIKDRTALNLEYLKQQGKVLQVREDAKSSQELEGFRQSLEDMRQQMAHRHETLMQAAEQRHEVLLQLLKEKAAKETERHSVALHDVAAREAEARLETRDARAADRDEGREDRAALRDDDLAALAGDRDERREMRRGARDAARETQRTPPAPKRPT